MRERRILVSVQDGSIKLVVMVECLCSVKARRNEYHFLRRRTWRGSVSTAMFERAFRERFSVLMRPTLTSSSLLLID
jgi:hypothetical protein